MIDQRGGHTGGQRRQKIFHRVGAFAGAQQQGRLVSIEFKGRLMAMIFLDAIKVIAMRRPLN
ncbi:MAG: hypothetical protein PVF79_05520, partial [Desulfobacterales bacterium]